MCARFALISDKDVIEEVFKVNVMQLEPRYNIAPSQAVAVIRQNLHTRRIEFNHVIWGFIPNWTKDISIGAKLINARAETLNEKPTFRSAYKYRRCIIPADGFYEWKTENSKKQPYYITMTDGKPFGIAGLWESWHSADGSEIESCCLITTEPNSLMANIHNRMPLILPTNVYEAWLSNRTPSNMVSDMLLPYPSDKMTAYPVNAQVNNPKAEGSALMLPLSAS